MAKKKKKKFFDLTEAAPEPRETLVNQAHEVEAGPGFDHQLLKKDLVRVLLVVSLFVGLLAGLYAVDKTSNYLTRASEIISSGFIR